MYNNIAKFNTNVKEIVKTFIREPSNLHFDCAISASQFIELIDNDYAKRLRTERDDIPISSEDYLSILTKKAQDEKNGMFYTSFRCDFNEKKLDNDLFNNINNSLNNNQAHLVCNNKHILVVAKDCKGKLYLLDPQAYNEPILFNSTVYLDVVVSYKYLYFICFKKND